MQPSRGFTAIELLVTFAVIAIVLGIAVPSFTDTLARRRVEGAANELSADLQYARTESVSRRTSVSLVATATTGYAIQYVDSGGVSQTLKSVTLPSNVSMTTGEAKFTYLRGMLDSSVAVPTFTLSSTKTTGQLTLALSAMGRVAMCTPSTAAMAGYKSC